MEDIAKHLRNERLAKGLTQQELADQSGLSLRSVQRIENAEVVPRIHTLKMICTVLNVSYDDLAKDLPQTKTNWFNRKLNINRTQQVALSFGSLLLLGALAFAFVAQSNGFPETEFELSLFISSLLAIYGLVFIKIWAGKN